MTTMHIGQLVNLGNHYSGTSFRRDVFCVLLAFAIHAPLFFTTFDMKGRGIDRSKGERLVKVDLIDPEAPKKPAPPPPAPKEEKSIFDKLKNLVAKEPPPPPKQVNIEPKKIDLQPKEIKLDPKTEAAKIQPKLQSKEGFQTKADPKLVQKVALSKGGVGLTPITVKKVGIKDPSDAQLKSSKSGFKVAQAESLQGIGGGPSISAGAAAPTLQIKTGKTASKEGFSLAPKQIENKGRLGDVNRPGGPDAELGLRDRIIARDAGATQIATTQGSRIPTPGSSGALGTKQDRGSFSGGGAAGGVAGGVPGGTVGGVVGGAGTTPSIAKAPVKKKKKEAFNITGPLKDRKRERQVLPEYPLWAQQQGIEAVVILSFTVDPQGNVKDNIATVRTSGYIKLDEVAKKALSKWKWVPLPADTFRDEVGQITFTFQLN